MRYTFNEWSPDDLIKAYLKFVKNKGSKSKTFIDYETKDMGLKQTAKGRLEITDPIFKRLPREVAFAKGHYKLELSQKDWKIKFKLIVRKYNINEFAVLIFDKSFLKKVYKQFKPEEV